MLQNISVNMTVIYSVLVYQARIKQTQCRYKSNPQCRGWFQASAAK